MPSDPHGKSASLLDQNSPAGISTSRSRLRFVKKYWDFLAVILLVVVSLPVIWLSPKSVLVISRPGVFDDNWVLDTVFRAAHGSWFGRDVSFVYGPIFEWLFSAPSRWNGLSLTAVYGSYNTLLLWCTFLFAYFALRLLLPEQANWKRFVLLLLLSVFWAPWDGRTAFAVFLFALFLRGWYAVGEARLNSVLLGSGSAFLCAVAFLYSADTGVYGIAALLLSLMGVASETPRKANRWKYVLAFISFAGTFALLVFAINALMASVLDFQFWRSSLALVSVHRWNEPSAMAASGTMLLLGTLIAGGVIYTARLCVPGNAMETIAARPGFLFSSFALAVLAMQSGLIRSDPMHIVFAVFCMVFFSAVVLFSFRSRLASALAALVVLACSLACGLPTTMFRPSSIRYRLAQLRHPSTECPIGFAEFQAVCYPTQFISMLDTADGYLNLHSQTTDSILIFPYQYSYGMTSGHLVAGGVLQSFLASGPYLSHLDIAGMAKAAAPVGLYFPDGPLSLPIDDVANFTRTPDIWFWIFSHYAAGPQLFPGATALQRADSRAARIAMESLPIGIPPQTYAITRRSAVVNLGAPLWPSGADFLKLRLKVHYGILWKLRKPERLQLEITRADGTRDLQAFVIGPNVASDVWFYPWNGSELGQYFDNDDSRWRITPRSPITELRLIVTPFDWVSQQPDAISLESASAVKVSMSPQALP